ncbi:nitrate ABC transporter substrate-binding protein [Microbacterium sp. VKM Ac-2870]|uniref:nitrate ABC transporter substrate-binding protein n=1 Tax=Microbacterium sp. VKM Ac-2870 TaxID=2783825 RepID=UPI00188D2BDB|nr:nitrate ABC transporter substrate-binding protein [Microbacterium sp. VKM Ac-2870]MBF4560628.1 nitrate ABC transporter substrate-binding protein [Microbacterium sp. VKM Ac-2870]
MTRSRFAPLALSAIALASVLLLSACATSTPSPAPTTTGNAVSPTPTDAAGEPTPLPTETSSAVGNCEQMIEPDTLAEFKAKGWTYKQKPFTFETQPPSAPLDNGIICTWANYSVSSGNLIDFGWAPITSDKAATAAAQLEKEGWRREPAESGFYITQDPAQAINTDDTGHGMTYQFGDGWVAVSDTKQSLLLMPVTATR